MSAKLTLRDVAVSLLILLWVYAAASKLVAFDDFGNQMSQQPLPPMLQVLLTYTLPPTELFVALLLMFRATCSIALYASAVLLLSFTIYIALGLLKFYKNVPCSCGGILRGLGWGPHLALNLFFLSLTIVIIKYPKGKEVFAASAN